MIIGILGTGNMALALAKGIGKSAKVLGYGTNKEKNRSFSKVAILVPTPEELYRKSDIIVFAVKPQSFDTIPESRKPAISVMAGIPIKKLRKVAKGKVLRLMLALSVADRKGAILRCGDRIKDFEDLLQEIGSVYSVEEKHLHELSLIAGSMPALIASFLLSVKKSIKAPLNDEEKMSLVLSAFSGIHLDQDLEGLISRVASKGGITEAYLGVQGRLDRLVKSGIASSSKRSRQLSK